jgi:nucleoside-diphosphate-sugar epimerase
MDVLVTGGLGRSGRWLVSRLARRRDVVCVDLSSPGGGTGAGAAGTGEGVRLRPGITARAADLADRGEALDVVADCDPDAVVHWAAIRTPDRHGPGRVFETNVLAAHNVLTAAGRAGARVVQASSEAVYGRTFAAEPWLPDALPVTEGHPLLPEDPYGTSKVVAETVGGTVARRYGVPVVSARLPWVQYPGEYACRARADDPAAGADTLWAYVDVRDVVSFVEAALEGPVEGHVPVNVAAADTYLARPTADLVRAAFGRLPPEFRLGGRESTLSVARAEHRFGWTPAHSWREAAEEAVAPPRLLADEDRG